MFSIQYLFSLELILATFPPFALLFSLMTFSLIPLQTLCQFINLFSKLIFLSVLSSSKNLDLDIILCIPLLSYLVKHILQWLYKVGCFEGKFFSHLKFCILLSYLSDGIARHGTLIWKLLQNFVVEVRRLFFFFFNSSSFIPEKAMATHSSTLGWKIPWTEEPGGLPSMGLHRVRHDWSALAATTSFVQVFCFPL